MFGLGVKLYTHYRDARDVQRTIDYFMVSNKSAVLSYESTDRGVNLSDHLPIRLCIRFTPVSVSVRHVVTAVIPM